MRKKRLKQRKRGRETRNITRSSLWNKLCDERESWGEKCDMFRIKSLMTVVNNYFRHLQRGGSMGEKHSTLSISDVRTIFKHLSGLLKICRVYRSRLLFTIGLVKRLRLTALHTLNLRQLKHENVHGQDCIMFYSNVGGEKAGFKTSEGRCVLYQTDLQYFRYITKTYWKLK